MTHSCPAGLTPRTVFATTVTIPVVALTASVTSTDRSAIAAAGFDAFLSKPINLKEFLDTVKRMVEKK